MSSDTADSPTSLQATVGAVYAKGILGAAEKQGASEVIVEQLESLVHDVLPAAERLEHYLVAPKISVEAKSALIDKAFGKQMHPLLVTFLKVVCQHRRFDCIRGIARAARKQLNDMRGVVEVQVRSASALDDAAKASLTQKLSQALGGKKVLLTTEVKPDLLGGLVIRVGDTLFDGSLQSQLEQLRENAIQRATQSLRGALEKFTSVGA